MPVCSPPPPRGRAAARAGAALVALATVAAWPGAATAQDAQTVRFGISAGGTSTIGLVVEYVDGHGSTDLTLGTWSFRDLSVSLVRRQYFGVSALRPVIGFGVWGILATPEGERPGMALVLRAPIGMDWRIDGDHYMTFDLNVNQGVWVRRTDPADETPLNRRLVPLPGVSYRWWSR